MNRRGFLGLSCKALTGLPLVTLAAAVVAKEALAVPNFVIRATLRADMERTLEDLRNISIQPDAPMTVVPGAPEDERDWGGLELMELDFSAA